MSEKAIAFALDDLADCEADVEKADEDIELYRIKRLQPVYEKRDRIIERIPGFWSIVLSQHSEFADYIKASDFRYVDAIERVIVRWNTPRDYEIEIKIRGIENEFGAQTLVKRFVTENENLTSEAVKVDISGASDKKSFINWFDWTGATDSNEFPNGGDLATLFSEDIYPYCVKYYTEAQRDVEDEESGDSDSEGELL